MSQAQPPTPGGAAEDGGTDAGMARLWPCPHCGFLVGWIDDHDNLVIWRYDVGCLTLRQGTIECACGAVIQWHKAGQRVLSE